MEFTLEQKVGQMLMVGFEGLEPPVYVLDWLAAGRIGGVILFGRNVDTPEQVAALTQACHEAASSPILIAIDQEGGRVARLRAGFSESPGAMALGAADSDELAERVSTALALEMRALGINWTLAPVVDIAHNAENPVIGTRALGSDPARVAALAAAQIRGFQRGNIATSAKHFPGHGNTPVDTHVDMATVGGSLEFLWAHDLVPFRAAVAAGVDSVMISHVKLAALDAEHPSTLSRVVVSGLLREQVGYDGLVCTDCMEMKALGLYYGVGERAVRAAQAGIDIIFFSHTRAYQEEAYVALLAAAQSGELPLAQIDAAVGRISALKAQVAITGEPQLQIIRDPDHLALMAEAARAGTVLLRADAAAYPLRPAAYGRSVLVEFPSYLDSEAMEGGGLSNLAGLLRGRVPGIDCLTLDVQTPLADAVSQVVAQAADAEVVILATRNAHLWPDELEVARAIIGAAQDVILLCLSNPYDADLLPGAGTVICTCGDAAPSLAAAVGAVLGDFTPSGRLPVALDKQ